MPALKEILAIALMALIASFPVQSSAQDTAIATDDASKGALVGLWGAEQVFGPLVRGNLIIDGRAPQWRASIAGFDVPVERDQNRVNFILPGDAGEFRGHLSTTSKTIDGDWIQPAGVVNNNRYATPVHLTPAG